MTQYMCSLCQAFNSLSSCWIIQTQFLWRNPVVQHDIADMLVVSFDHLLSLLVGSGTQFLWHNLVVRCDAAHVISMSRVHLLSLLVRAFGRSSCGATPLLDHYGQEKQKVWLPVLKLGAVGGGEKVQEHPVCVKKRPSFMSLHLVIDIAIMLTFNIYWY